jgi:cell wall-associated NlpC family hydrolase
MLLFNHVRFQLCLLVSIALVACTSCHSSRVVTTQTKQTSSVAKEYKPLRKRVLKRKYATILDTKPSKIKNKKLYYFIDEWSGVRYKWGGNDKNGVDCSGFVHQLYLSVYGLKIQRTVATIHTTTKNFHRQRRLREGDILYFKDQDDPTHVGIYLHNGYFVHSSKGTGVHISNLKEPYWNKAYTGGGKIRSKRK